MAKTVASLQKGAGKGHAKVIKMVKSEKTGALLLKKVSFQTKWFKNTLKSKKYYLHIKKLCPLVKAFLYSKMAQYVSNFVFIVMYLKCYF